MSPSEPSSEAQLGVLSGLVAVVGAGIAGSLASGFSNMLLPLVASSGVAVPPMALQGTGVIVAVLGSACFGVVLLWLILRPPFDRAPPGLLVVGLIAGSVVGIVIRGGGGFLGMMYGYRSLSMSQMEPFLMGQAAGSSLGVGIYWSSLLAALVISWSRASPPR